MKLGHVLRIIPIKLLLLLLLGISLSTLLLKSVHVLRTNAKRPHVLVDFEGHLHLIIFDAAYDERFVQRKVALDASSLHHLLRHEGLLNVAILAVAFDHNAVGDEVRLASGTCIRLQHLLEDQRRLRHVEAANAAVKKRVEGDNIWRHVLVVLHLLKHSLVELEGFLQLVRLLIGLDHSRVDDCVHGHPVLLHRLED